MDSFSVFRRRGESDPGDDALTTIVGGKKGKTKAAVAKNGAKNVSHINQVIENDYVLDVKKRSIG